MDPLSVVVGLVIGLAIGVTGWWAALWDARQVAAIYQHFALHTETRACSCRSESET